MNRVKKDSLDPCEEQDFLSSQVLSLRLEQRREGGGDRQPARKPTAGGRQGAWVSLQPDQAGRGDREFGRQDFARG